MRQRREQLFRHRMVAIPTSLLQKTNALKNLTTGAANTAVGWYSLFGDTTASFNTGVGAGTLLLNNGDSNTAVGVAALLSNTPGSCGGPNESNRMRLGRTGDAPTLFTYIAGILGTSVSGAAVYIDSEDQLGTVNSSRRFKHDIKPIDQASEAILSLKPVTFHYNGDMKAIPQFGLIAEEVAEANPDLIMRDKNGEIYTVRYDAVNAMLLNEFLKEHRKIQALCTSDAEQKKEIAEQRKQIRTLTAQLKEQAVEIQKVSTRIATGSSSVADLR